MRAFLNLRLFTKLMLSFGVVLALCLGLGVFSVVQLAKVNQTSTDLQTNWMPSVRMLLEMKYDVARYRAQETQHILSNTEADFAKYEKRMVEFKDKLKAHSAEYEKLISEPEERAGYAEFNKLWDQYIAISAEVQKLSRASQDDEAKALIRGKSSTLFNSASEILEKLAEVNIKGGNQASEHGNELYASARWWIIGIIALCIAIGMVQAVWISGLISRPLVNAVQIAQTVAAGNLTSQIDVSTTDETGQLLAALKEMNDNLQNIVGQVRTGTDVIATAASEIATGNLDLSARTEQQASSLEETASSMEEMTSTVKQNSDNARRANELAHSASGIALQGGNVVSQVVETMGSINASSSKIVDIIGVIDGIAFQTNILALNAAVEAARAGEQGRGFAVVASEVRNLAQRSASAAKEIKGLITDSVAQVEAGSKLVHQAGKTMDEVVASVKKVSDIVAEITTAGREQEVGIEQINQAITEMDAVTQQNAALVEQAAAASASMQEQAENLSRVVSVFKLDQNAAAPSMAAPRPAHAAASAPPRPAAPKAAPRPQLAQHSAQVTPLRPAAAKAKATASTEGDWEEF
ncbi:methyl-accepting chemotaxis protein [Duganella sp. CF402]|uniref:methyl-accepting chemotaxis protein n=1 Tax=unclassified Duganella TaxID=2636909 RepID=UPI0008B32C57|nr:MULTISPECIES: methyl-accepting chemotaxis protein [unclassified Duganella]RZT04165.1 methyl-accepting chemotaxis protein [Duganella sp. BK701]SEM45708.1 methyl-accepting chemotaxis protein [Duganella sp. CF402]